MKSIQIFFRITLRLIFYLIGAFFFVESNCNNDLHVSMIFYNIPFSVFRINIIANVCYIAQFPVLKIEVRNMVRNQRQKSN